MTGASLKFSRALGCQHMASPLGILLLIAETPAHLPSADIPTVAAGRLHPGASRQLTWPSLVSFPAGCGFPAGVHDERKQHRLHISVQRFGPRAVHH